jgi:3',5'-cyclic AMP phosphodiesterase CpdA
MIMGDKNLGHANQSYRFVQLSDLHLSSPGFPNPYRLFNKRILGYLSWLKKRRFIHQRRILDCAIDEISSLDADHLVITGDLLHIGLRNEFEQSAKWLAQLDGPSDITIIPGNHDLYVREKWSRSFDYWQEFMIGDNTPYPGSPDSDNALDKLNALYPIIRVRNQVAFIGISSVFESPWFRATGLICNEQLSRLKTMLNNSAFRDYCKVLLVHHPVTLTHTKPRKCLINHRELTDLLSQSPVDLVLHGHEHKTSIEYITLNNNKNIPVVGIASSSSASTSDNTRAEFALYDIQKNNSAWNILMDSFRFNANIDKFEKTNSRSL